MRKLYLAEMQRKMQKTKEQAAAFERLKLKRESDERIEITAYIFRREPAAAGDIKKIMQDRVRLARENNFSLNRNDVLLLDAIING